LLVKNPLFRRSLILISLVILADQALKVWVKTNMDPGFLGQIRVIGDWFYLHYTENPGMAFGQTLFKGELVGKLVLSIFRITAVIGISWYLIGLIKKEMHSGLVLCISLILAGAIGNILDSAFYDLIFTREDYSHIHYFNQINGERPRGFLLGSVVDMLHFPMFEGKIWDWVPFWGGQNFLFFRPVFNIADSAISIGVAIMIIRQKAFFKPTEKDLSTSNQESAEAA